MSSTLVLSVEFENKLNSVNQSTTDAWNGIGLLNITDVINSIITKMNSINEKLDISSFEFRNDVDVLGESSDYFGFVINENGDVIAYTFAVPPHYPTRSGVLAQQVFPVLSGFISRIVDSELYRISNRPVYILNFNEAKHTASMAVNYFSGEILGFYYIDLFERDIHQILVDNGFDPSLKTLSNYNYILSSLQGRATNEIFLIENGNTIKFLKTRLKDGVHVNNEPYWFVLKAYAALYLSINEHYTIDMSEIDRLNRGNRTLDAFRDYVQRFMW